MERSDKVTEEKQQKALHEAVVRLVKPGKAPGQHKMQHPAPEKKGQGQYRKKKTAKKGGQPFKQGNPGPKSGRKSDAHP